MDCTALEAASKVGSWVPITSRVVPQGEANYGCEEKKASEKGSPQKDH